jgi:hypothetical protein
MLVSFKELGLTPIKKSVIYDSMAIDDILSIGHLENNDGTIDLNSSVVFFKSRRLYMEFGDSPEVLLNKLRYFEFVDKKLIIASITGNF